MARGRTIRPGGRSVHRWRCARTSLRRQGNPEEPREHARNLTIQRATVSRHSLTHPHMHNTIAMATSIPTSDRPSKAVGVGHGDRDAIAVDQGSRTFGDATWDERVSI